MFELHLPTSSITQLETGLTLSPDEFQKKIEEKSHELKVKYGVGPHSAVLLLQHNSISFFITLLALFKLKATAVPLDPQSSELERKNIKIHASINLVITENEIISENNTSSSELDGIALLLYTSGTTGKPKGVKLSYKAIQAKIETLSHVISIKERETSLCFLPTFFGHGLICNSLFSLYYSKNFIIANKLDILVASKLKSILNKYKVTFFSSVPSIWQLILNFTEESDTELPYTKRVHCASAPLKNDKAMEVQKWLGPNVSFYNIFGITEMSGWFAHKKYSDKEDVGTFTDFWEAQTRINTNGELLIKSPYMFSGYLNNPTDTALSMEEGFFKTGDLFHENKYAGRLKLIINKKGMKIYPNDIDEFLLTSGLVEDCYTFGVKDKYAGENIAVLLVLKAQGTIEQLREFCQKNLPPHKFPDRMIEVEKIERTSRGKIAQETISKYQVNDDES